MPVLYTTDRLQWRLKIFYIAIAIIEILRPECCIGRALGCNSTGIRTARFPNWELKEVHGIEVLLARSVNITDATRGRHSADIYPIAERIEMKDVRLRRIANSIIEIAIAIDDFLLCQRFRTAVGKLKVVKRRLLCSADILVRCSIEVDRPGLLIPRAVIREIPADIIRPGSASRSCGIIREIGRDGYRSGIVDRAGVIRGSAVDLDRGAELRNDGRAIIIENLGA